jgi:hypothetical protein
MDWLMVLIHSIRTGRSALLQPGDPNRSPVPLDLRRRLGGGASSALRLRRLLGMSGRLQWLGRGLAAVAA